MPIPFAKRRTVEPVTIGGRWRRSQNRDDRKLTFDTFWGKWLEYRNSVGAVLNSHIQTQVALAKARKARKAAERAARTGNDAGLEIHDPVLVRRRSPAPARSWQTRRFPA